MEGLSCRITLRLSFQITGSGGGGYRRPSLLEMRDGGDTLGTNSHLSLFSSNRVVVISDGHGYGTPWWVTGTGYYRTGMGVKFSPHDIPVPIWVGDGYVTGHAMRCYNATTTSHHLTYTQQRENSLCWVYVSLFWCVKVVIATLTYRNKLSMPFLCSTEVETISVERVCLQCGHWMTTMDGNKQGRG